MKYRNKFAEKERELQRRIDKAIEYIKNTPLYTETYDYNMEDNLELNYVSDEKAHNDLLNISGSSKSSSQDKNYYYLGRFLHKLECFSFLFDNDQLPTRSKKEKFMKLVSLYLYEINL